MTSSSSSSSSSWHRRWNGENPSRMMIMMTISTTLSASFATILYLWYQNKGLKEELLTAKNNNNNNNEKRKKKEKRKKNKSAGKHHDDGVGKSSTCWNSKNVEMNENYSMCEIGKVVSPYKQLAGTPRQGLLVSHSRSYIQMHSMDASALDGLNHHQYSHVWIIFSFHLSSTSSKKTKVKPPRANGQKVGIFATRSPHRPNSIGISIAKLESIDETTCRISLLGLDLVHGTPVYDIKPYIPSDSIPIHHLQVPSWVSSTNDQFTNISWNSNAFHFITTARQNGHLQPFYPPLTNITTTTTTTNNNNNNKFENEKDDVHLAIEEIIKQDPRAQHEGRGLSSKQDYQITFDTLRIQFQVTTQHHNTHNTTHTLMAQITNVELDQGDDTAPKGSYQYNLAIRKQAEKLYSSSQNIDSNKQSKQLRWKYSLQEGMSMEDVYKLQNDTIWDASKINQNIDT